MKTCPNPNSLVHELRSRAVEREASGISSPRATFTKPRRFGHCGCEIPHSVFQKAQISVNTNSLHSNPSHVVGIGASAGGLEALERLFKSLPVDTGMAFVVVQHLSPDFKSLMNELLARHTSMAIQRVEDGARLEANTVYLIPPKMDMAVEGDHLRLTAKKTSEGLSLPIDNFFHSVAAEWGMRSVGVVLSGTGSDGSRGIRAIHEAGGLVLSQSTDSAKFDGMPRSAEKTGVVDLVQSPEDLAITLGRYSQFPVGDKAALLDKPVIVDENSMNRLLRLLREEFNIDFACYKSGTVMRRIERRVLLSHSADFDEYVHRVSSDPDELNSLYKDLLIGVTCFFRDPAAYDQVEKRVLPELLQQLGPGDQFRAWVAGCATGEEAYSLAILLFEVIEDLQIQVDVKIFATDVHQQSLDFASAGIYPESSLADISIERRRRFFSRTARGFQLIPELRQMIVFAPHNVISDAPFTKLDYVSCRNMLIYFQQDAQIRVMTLFHFALKKKGVLFLGPSETLAELSSEFETLDNHWKLYRKKRDVRLTRELQIGSDAYPALTAARVTRTTPTFSPAGDQSLTRAYDTLLDHYMPAGILLDDQRQLVHVFGDTSKFVQIRAGRPSQDALDLFAPGLRAAAAGALHRATRDLATVHYSGLKLSEDSDDMVRLAVEPIKGRDGELTHLMITFETVGQLQQPTTGQELNVGEVSTERMTLLEGELRTMRENLQATIEELETSNEELQATNEELVASNEELQSTNEELHSVNEELYTVNAEYQKKITELTVITDDMNHLFEHLDTGLVFLDNDLSVRKFTPSIAKVFSLLPQDIGRSFSDFTHTLNRPSLVHDLESVIKTQVPVEKEVGNREGRSYVMRIQPYLSRRRVDGVVLELFDVSDVKKTKSRLRQDVRRLQTALDIIETPICLKDTSGHSLFMNESYADTLGHDRADLVQKTDHEVLPPDVADALTAADLETLKSGERVLIEEIPFGHEGKKHTVIKAPVRSEDGRIEAIVTRILPPIV